MSHEEVGDLVHVTFRAPDGRIEQIRAKRLIKAFGHQVTPSSPLEISSGRVRSTTPELLDLQSEAIRKDDARSGSSGSGKTAMDTAHLIITELPGREVNLAAGPGTFFARRDSFFPTGARRWWGGTPINTASRQVARRFDGTNEAEVRDWYLATYGIGPTNDAKDFFSAYLSDSELAVITAGLGTIEAEYFADAVDRDDGVDLVFRGGRTRTVPTGPGW